MLVPAAGGGGLNSFEPNFWGLAVATILLGVSIFQGYIFFTNYNDSCRLRLFVAVLLLLDFSTTFFYSFALREMLIVNRGSPSNLSGAGPTLLAESTATLVVTWLTHLFFAFRVYQINHGNRIVPVLIVIFASLSLAAGIIRVKFMVVLSLNNMVTLRYKILNTLSGVFAAISDILATVSMCLTFVHSAFDTKRLDSVLRHLMIYTFNRGIIVTSAQILVVVLYVYAPQKFYWFPVHICLSKLYVNTLLAMLNSRARLRSKISQTVDFAPNILHFTHASDAMTTTVKLRNSPSGDSEGTTVQSLDIEEEK
ncbi:hypothetical protein BD410DRAFT_160284 [Rickenella mellea]|uniref:DUF6534 domain-containing protein n=1 Tax=Rickenella mellea TaxID=50990 RepID=A0A4Y7Q9E5_9AGAM|nr:hypothetical protein BD410DRAFT_160284 [Rickenella mellea]